MLAGKLITQLDKNYRVKTLDYIDCSTMLNPFDINNTNEMLIPIDFPYSPEVYSDITVFKTLPTLDIENGLIQIGQEWLSYAYREAAGDYIRLYVVQRALKCTSMQEHKPGTFIYKLSTIIEKNYDSQNIRDIQLDERKIHLSPSNQKIEDIRGIDVILQDVKLTMINAGNELLNSQSDYETLFDKNWLTAFYTEQLLNSPLGISQVNIIDIQNQQDNPNKIVVVADVFINHQIYSNIQIVLGSKRGI